MEKDYEVFRQRQIFVVGENKGRYKMILLLIGPAGSGKTTLCRKLEKAYKPIKIYTTRKRRADDSDNYIFVTKDEFISLYNENKILTKAEIIGNYYGIQGVDSESGIYTAVGDIFTLRQLREKNISFTSCFLDVPLDICKERIIARGDEPEEVEKKIALEKEWGDGEKKECDYVVSEIEFESVYREILKIIEKEYKPV